MQPAGIEKDVSDEVLMRNLASGQQDAIGTLYARYAPTILGMAAADSRVFASGSFPPW